MNKIILLISIILISNLCSCIAHSRWNRPTSKEKISTYSDVIDYANDKWNRSSILAPGKIRWRDGVVNNIKIADFTISEQFKSRKDIIDTFYADMKSFCECNEGTFYNLYDQDKIRVVNLQRKHLYTRPKTTYPDGTGPALFECGPKGYGTVSNDWTKFDPAKCRRLYEKVVDVRKVSSEYGNPSNFVCKKEGGAIFTGKYERGNRWFELSGAPTKVLLLEDLVRLDHKSVLIQIQLNQAKHGLIPKEKIMKIETLDNYRLNENAKSAKAQFKQGVYYEKEVQDYTQAANWYKKAALQGHPIAQDFLGFLYAKGRGVPQDFTEAIKWFRKSVSQGARSGQNNLAYMYAVGRGVPQNYDEAFKLYSMSAAQGHLQAQNNLGMMYVNGQGTPQNYAEAIKWFRKAANKGLALAQYNLGNMYLYGLGIAANNFEAAKWYKKAAAQGHPAARSAFEKISKKIYNAK